MLSKILQFQEEKIKIEKTKNNKVPTPFPKKEEKKEPLSKQTEKNSLKTFYDLLTKQKEDAPYSAIGPFDPTSIKQTPLIEKDAMHTTTIQPSVQVMQVYHKIVEALPYIHQEGMQETTLFLEGDSFASSIFQGAKITLTEYSTAPKIFNIHFFANNNALQVFEAHAAELAGALQNGNFGFQVHRIDSSPLTEDERHAFSPIQRDLDKEKDKDSYS